MASDRRQVARFVRRQPWESQPRMLYIAEALKSTAVTHSCYVPRFCAGVDALVVAKGGRIEVYPAGEEGLGEACGEEVWGVVVGLEWVGEEVPHVAVMTDHPLARILLYRWPDASDPGATPRLVLTDAFTLTPTKFTAEFHTGLTVDRARGTLVASLYSGVLGVFKVGEGLAGDAAKPVVGKKPGVKRKASGKGKGKEKEEEVMNVDVDEPRERGNLVFKEKHEVPIHIYNLLSVAFLATPEPSKPAALAFLYVTPDYTIELGIKTFSDSTHEFKDFCPAIDVLSPPSTYALPTSTNGAARPDPSALQDDFACPGAAKLLALPVPSDDFDDAQLGGILVIGDEFSAAYTLRTEKSRTSSISSGGQSFAERTSPENTKRRKGSAGGSLVPVVGGKSSGEGAGKVVLARQWRVRQGFGEVSGATAVAGPTPFVLLGDKQGRLSVLTCPLEGNRATASFVGTVSPASCISYLDAGLVFIGSESGDCQIIRLEIGSQPSAQSSRTAKGKGKATGLSGIREESMEPSSSGGQTSLTLMDSWANLAPIKDFCIVPEDTTGGEGGAKQIVTASGQASGASVRVVRSGVGAEEMVVVEGINEVVSVWPVQGLKGKSGSESGIVVSTYDCSILLSLSGTEQDTFGAQIVHDSIEIVADHPTLKAGNIAEGTMIQITPSQVKLISCETGKTVSVWSGLAAGEQVVLADFDGEHVVLGLAKAEVVVLKVEEGSDGLGLAVVKRHSLQHEKDTELACLALVSRVQAKLGAGPALIVGYWGSNHLHCVDLSTLQPRSQDLVLPTLPCSACVRSSGGDLQLLIGLGDGAVISYNLVIDWTPTGDPSITFGNRKTMQVGSAPVMLSHSRTTDQVVAISDRTALLAEENGRMSFAPMNVKSVTWASYIDTAGLGNCLLTASPSGLAFTRITSLKKLHIKKISLDGYVPIAIAYDADIDHYGIASVTEQIDQEYGDLVRSGSFHIMSNRDQTISKAFDLDSGEEPICLEQIRVHGENYFALGTMFPEDLDDAGTTNKGYLRLIKMAQRNGSVGQTPIVIARWQASGCVQDVKAVWNKVAIALDYGVDLLEFDAAQPVDNALQKIASWGCASKAAFLSVQRIPRPTDAMDDDDAPAVARERLHVGDSVKSVYVLELSGTKLVDVARDYMQNWVVAMEELNANDGSVVIADLSYNVKTLTFEDGKVQNAGALALHELVTKFQRGSITSVDSGSGLTGGRPKPEVVFTTSSGTIGVIAEIGAQESQLLSELQLNMDGLVKGPLIEWRKYREIHMEGTTKAPGTVGFIDGNFVQKYLDIAAHVKELSDKILAGPNEFSRVGRSRIPQNEGEEDQPAPGATKEEVVSLLETLATLH